MPLAIGDHSARVAAAMEWLIAQCGDYAPLRRKFIEAYFDFVGAVIETHRAELDERLKPYDGLFAPEDFMWSALRPLPRGFVPVGDRFLPADIVFWDGGRAIAVQLAARETDKQRALATAGVTVVRVGADGFAQLGAVLPTDFQGFSDGGMLPSSPFRRPMPQPPSMREA